MSKIASERQIQKWKTGSNHNNKYWIPVIFKLTTVNSIGRLFLSIYDMWNFYRFGLTSILDIPSHFFFLSLSLSISYFLWCLISVYVFFALLMDRLFFSVVIFNLIGLKSWTERKIFKLQIHAYEIARAKVTRCRWHFVLCTCDNNLINRHTHTRNKHECFLSHSRCNLYHFIRFDKWTDCFSPARVSKAVKRDTTVFVYKKRKKFQLFCEHA